MTVYASIGNSDDKLTQAEWSGFVRTFRISVKAEANRILGNWHSPPDDAYQNACMGFEIGDAEADRLMNTLRELAGQYRQDSIAWAEVSDTLFLCTA